jgi:hypothetical protein
MQVMLPRFLYTEDGQLGRNVSGALYICNRGKKSGQFPELRVDAKARSTQCGGMLQCTTGWSLEIGGAGG